MIAFQLPWPPSTLSPNRRLHWARVAKEKHRYRETCETATREQIGTATRMGQRLILELEFAPPSRRRFDVDGVLSRMKSGLDGACDALGIDDNRFVEVRIRRGEPVKSGVVAVRIREEGCQRCAGSTIDA